MLQRILKTGRLALVGILFTAAQALAQGTVKGKVTDAQTGEGLPGTNIVIASKDGFSRGVTTNVDGFYLFKNIPAGSYVISVSYVGYREYRSDSFDVPASGEITFDIALEAGVSLNPVVVSASKFQEKITEAPAAMEVLDPIEIKNISTASAADLIKGAKSVDIAQQGIASQTVVTRGFNNIFSGSLLVLTDNRIGSIPSLRANALHFLQITNDDIEQIEMVLGPGSALYGPNVNSGIMHMITKSPLTSQGTTVGVFGGERSFMKIQARTAHKLTNKVGFKISAQYAQAKDFRLSESAWDDNMLRQAWADYQLARQSNPNASFSLPGTWNTYRLNELQGRAQFLVQGDALNPANNLGGVSGAAGDPNSPKGKVIGFRNYDVTKLASDARLDFQLADDFRVVLSGGYNIASNIDLTGLGAAQARDWSIYYAQARATKGGLFAQAYINGTNSGDTYIIPTGNLIYDRSQLFVSQIQHNLEVNKFKLTYGGDFLLTTPRTGSTINGLNETIDQVSEVGVYGQAKYGLNEKIDLLGSFRMDKHSELQYPVFSPRFALVYKHNPSNTFRFTYNRSFGTPSSNNLWLDLQAGLAATPFAQSLGLAFQVRAQGVPSSGFNFSRDALGNPHWYSPANNTAIGGTGPNTPLAFNSAAAWPFLSRILAAGMANGLRGFYIQQGMSVADATNLANQEVAKMDLSRPANIALLMRVLNTATSQFGDPVSDVVNISRMKPTIYNTFEVGYKGIINNKLLLTTDFYYTRAYDFVGPLIVETPNVFMSEPDMISFMSEKLAGAQGINTAIATIIASNVAGALRGLPVGVVSPRETFYKDAMVLTYRNFGEINYFGIDLGFEYLIGSEYRVMGNYSYISNDKWLNLDGREGFDIYLNAPQNKAMIGFGYNGRSNGVSANIRYRWIQGFEIKSGIYSTERRNALGQLQHFPIPDYSVLDLNFGYEIKQVKGLRANLTITNALNRRAPQFAGTPDIGRLTIAGLTYNF